MANISLKDYIVGKYGKEMIQEARNRLCRRCMDYYCHLLPITSNGEDCPYLRPPREVSNDDVSDQ